MNIKTATYAYAIFIIFMTTYVVLAMGGHPL